MNGSKTPVSKKGSDEELSKGEKSDKEGEAKQVAPSSEKKTGEWAEKPRANIFLISSLSQVSYWFLNVIK